MTTITSSPRASVSDAGFNELVTAHRTTSLAYATRLTGDVHRAEDAAQEVWIRAWNHRERLTAERGSVRGWLLRVTHNVVVDQHRARSARATEVELDAGIDHQPPTGDRCDDVLTSLAVRPVLDRLTKPHREIIVEVYFRDRTAVQAAATLRVPVGTVKSRLHHALRTLRELVPAPTLSC